MNTMNKSGSEGGATLVELLVAASVMIVAAASVVAGIRAGTELEVTDNHRRDARAVVTGWFEEHFTAVSYDTITVPDTVTTADTLFSAEGVMIPCTLTVIKTADTILVKNDSIPVKIADAQIVWREPERMDTLELSRWTADIQ